MTIIKTIVVEGDGIALDRLLFETLRREDMVPAVLDANPGLAALGPVLPPGSRIRIPEPPATNEAIAILPVVTLWSE